MSMRTYEELLAAQTELAHFNPNHDPKDGKFAKKNGGSASVRKNSQSPSKKKDTKAAKVARKAFGAALFATVAGPEKYVKYKIKEQTELATKDKSIGTKMAARAGVKAAIEALDQHSEYKKTKDLMERSGTWNSDIEKSMKQEAAYKVGKTAVKKAVQEYSAHKVSEFVRPKLDKMAEKAAAKKKAEYEERMAAKKKRNTKSDTKKKTSEHKLSLKDIDDPELIDLYMDDPDFRKEYNVTKQEYDDWKRGK